jgi:hypothetical protein
MIPLAERLTRRFEDEICRVCVRRTASGDCSLEPGKECPVFRWADELAEIMTDVDSIRLADYMDRIQAAICPRCAQDDRGCCIQRDRLDCPLDLYLGLIVRILEEELESPGR